MEIVYFSHRKRISEFTSWRKAALKSPVATETDCLHWQIPSSECFFTMFLPVHGTQFVVCHLCYSQFRREQAVDSQWGDSNLQTVEALCISFPSPAHKAWVYISSWQVGGHFWQILDLYFARFKKKINIKKNNIPLTLHKMLMKS